MSNANAPRITYYVVMFPQPVDSGISMRPVSRLLKVEEDDARQMMLTKSFMVLSRFAKRPNAEGLQNQLSALGVPTIILSDQDVRGHLFLYASTASRGAGGIAFRDFDDKPLYTPYEDVMGVLCMEVFRENGERTLLIDLHRRSSTITPRLDADLFNFPTLMGAEAAGAEDFLADLESRCKISVDRRYAAFRPEIVQSAKDFGSHPMEFLPSAGKLPSPYLPDDQMAAAIWSFLNYRKNHSV